MENHGFCIAKNMKNTDTEWRFLGDHQKRLHFKFVLFLTFAQKWESILEKENPENTFLENQKNRKKCYHEWETRFSVFWGANRFPTFGLCYFHFSIFCRTIENEHFWKSAFFIIPDHWKKLLFWKCSFSMLALEMDFEKMFPISFRGSWKVHKKDWPQFGLRDP